MDLKEYCAKNKIRLTTVAKHLKMVYNHLLMQVHGKRNFTWQTAKEISIFTGGQVTVDELMTFRMPTHCSKCKQPLPKV
jgi:hypothetical protein